MIVPVQIGPNGGIGIEIFATAQITKYCALSGNDDDRLAIKPVAHLRERVPEIRMIKLGERMHGADQRQISNLRLETAVTSWLTSAAACAALTVKRKRACPRATVG